jgi:hypothetical protein
MASTGPVGALDQKFKSDEMATGADRSWRYVMAPMLPEATGWKEKLCLPRADRK